MKSMRKGNDNMIFMKPGFVFRYTRNLIVFVSEFALYQYLLRREHYPFMNVYYNRTKPLPSSSLLTPIFYAGAISALITTITHPLYVLEKRRILN
jgi:hypothetical protein